MARVNLALVLLGVAAAVAVGGFLYVAWVNGLLADWLAPLLP